MVGPAVLVVEDDDALRGVVARALRENGLEVTTTTDGRGALAAVGTATGDRFAAIVLDIGLPDSDGRDVCQALRARGVLAPVLFLTARGQLHDVLSGFAAGADDYLAKPFHVDELLARLAVLVRRTAPTAPSTGTELLLDPARHALTGPGGSHRLTPTEFRILAALMASPGEVLRRNRLLAAGWPHGARVADNTLDQYVARLRRKLDAADPGRSLTTVHGVGYRFS